MLVASVFKLSDFQWCLINYEPRLNLGKLCYESPYQC